MVIRFRKREISLFFFLIYSIIICSFGYGRIQQVAFIAFCASTMVYVGLRGKLKLGRFGACYVFFTLWSWIQIFFGLCIDRGTSVRMAETLLLNVLFIIMCYSVIMDVKDEQKLINAFVVMYAISLIIIIIGFGGRIFKSRLGLVDQNGISFKLLGLTSKISPNSIGLWTSIAFLLSLYLNTQTPKRKYLFYMLFFLVGNIMAASRKGVLTLGVGVLIYYLFRVKRSKRTMRFLYAIVGLMVAIFLVYEIDFLYDKVGYRIDQIIKYVKLSTIDPDIIGGSLRTRVVLLQRAKEYFSSKPITGYGINSYSYMNPLHIVADNNYWEILVAGGIIGFGLYYGFWLKVAVSIVRCKNRDNFYWLIVALFAIALVSDFTGSNYYLRSTIFPMVLADAFFSLHQYRTRVALIKENKND